MIRAASGVNNIRALKYWENWALQRIRLTFTNSCFSPSSSNLPLIRSYPTNNICLSVFVSSPVRTQTLIPQPRLPATLSAQVSCWPCDEPVVVTMETFGNNSIHVKGGHMVKNQHVCAPEEKAGKVCHVDGETFFGVLECTTQLTDVKPLWMSLKPQYVTTE